MNIAEYKKIALQRLNRTIAHNREESICYSCMGLIEETGEIIAELRKPLFKGNFHEKTLNTESIKSELGDLIWYIVLMCNECNVSVEELEEFEVIQSEDIKLPRREKIIRVAINMGQTTGQITSECMKIYNENKNNKELVGRIRQQYKNIKELAEILDISMQQVLSGNVEKINSRYNEKGDINR